MMNISTSNKVAIFSDLHMGVHCHSPLWHKISLNYAKWLAKSLKAKGITDIIFCGDFFHDRDSVAVSTIHAASNFLNELIDFNIMMFPGNHDCFYKQHAEINSLSILEGRKNLTVFHKVQRISIGDNCTATLCPWGTTVEEIDPCDVTFGHFEIQTFKMNTFKMCEHGMSIRQILERSPLIFSGHFHWRDERLFEIGKIIYVGNPFQMDMNDSNNVKGYYIFDGGEKSFEFVENDMSPLLYRFKLSYICNEEMDLDELYRMVHGNVIQFIIDEHLSSDDLAMLKNKISSFKPLQIDFSEEYSDAQRDQEQSAFDGIDAGQAIVEFIELMNYPNKAELQKYAIDLYRKYK